MDENDNFFLKTQNKKKIENIYFSSKDKNFILLDTNLNLVY
jgi:hypothetical protein